MFIPPPPNIFSQTIFPINVFLTTYSEVWICSATVNAAKANLPDYFFKMISVRCCFFFFPYRTCKQLYEIRMDKWRIYTFDTSMILKPCKEIKLQVTITPLHNWQLNCFICPQDLRVTFVPDSSFKTYDALHILKFLESFHYRNRQEYPLTRYLKTISGEYKKIKFLHQVFLIKILQRIHLAAQRRY